MHNIVNTHLKLVLLVLCFLVGMKCLYNAFRFRYIYSSQFCSIIFYTHMIDLGRLYLTQNNGVNSFLNTVYFYERQSQLPKSVYIRDEFYTKTVVDYRYCSNYLLFTYQVGHTLGGFQWSTC